MTPEDEGGEDQIKDEEVWACLTPADLEIDLEDLEADDPSCAEHAELEQVLGKMTAFASGNSDAIASGLQKLCAEAEMLQFNLAAMVAKVACGCLGQNERTDKAKLPLVKLPWPSVAQSLAEYEQRLAVLPECMAVTRELHLALDKVDPRQDAKDINRDTLEVNGLQVFGAQGGYQAAVDAVAHALDADGSQTQAQLLLSLLNRTTSGFVAFEEVLRLLDGPEVVISPESAKARPLELAITCDEHWVALGRAHTRYAVHRSDASGCLAAVDAFVCFRLSSQMLHLAQTSELKVPATVLMYRSGANTT